MAIKQIFRLTAIVGSLILSQPLMAADGPSSDSGFYGGIGLGGQIIFDDATDYNYNYDYSDLVINATVGYEDVGWAVEARGSKTRGFMDTFDTQRTISLAYRTIEKNGRYLKVKAGKAYFSGDYDYEKPTSFGMGIGFRVDRDNRVELEYEYTPFKYFRDTNGNGIYYNGDQTIHMVSMNYLFGGPTYNSRGTEGATQVYAGVFLGVLEPDADGYDLAPGYGILLGYEYKNSLPGLATEFQFVQTVATNAGDDSEYKNTTYAIYAAYRTSGRFYVKAKLGYMGLYEEEEDTLLGGVETINETAPSTGIGLGFKLKNQSRLEIDVTASFFDLDGYKWNPIFLSTAYIF